MYPFERFTENSKAVLTLAQKEAELNHHSYIGTEHLLVGLLREQRGFAAGALKAFGLDTDYARRELAKVLTENPETGVHHIIPTSRVKRVIELAFEEARSEARPRVETGHLLVALLREGHGMGAQVLLQREITVERVAREIARLRSGGLIEGEGATPIKLRHLEMTDEAGKPINVDISFPADYSLEQEDRIASRIRDAVERKET